MGLLLEADEMKQFFPKYAVVDSTITLLKMLYKLNVNSVLYIKVEYGKDFWELAFYHKLRCYHRKKRGKR